MTTFDKARRFSRVIAMAMVLPLFLAACAGGTANGLLYGGGIVFSEPSDLPSDAEVLQIIGVAKTSGLRGQVYVDAIPGQMNGEAFVALSDEAMSFALSPEEPMGFVGEMWEPGVSGATSRRSYDGASTFLSYYDEELKYLGEFYPVVCDYSFNEDGELARLREIANLSVFIPGYDDVEIDNSQTRIEIMLQEYEEQVIAELLMISYDGQQAALEEFGGENPEIELINNEIMAGPLQMYQDYQNGDLAEQADSIDIHSYAFSDEEFLQIITTCTVFPETQPELYTRMWSYNFSKSENKWITVDEMLEEYHITREDASEAFNSLYQSDYDNETVVGVEVTGFLINRVPATPKTHFLLEVTLETESDPYKSFFLYTPDNEEIEALTPGNAFSPDFYDMDSFDTPLLYEYSVSTPAAAITAEVSGFDEVSPGSEYMLDGLLFLQLQEFPAIATALYDEAGMVARLMELEGEEIRMLSATLSQESTSQLSYPTWLLVYETGENEDAARYADLYVQTDAGEFRVHTKVPVDFAADYEETIEELLHSVALAG